MYYHPAMYEWANGERAVATCQAMAGVWLDGVAKQQQAHADAVNAFYTRQVESLRMASEARDVTQLAAHLLACAAPERLGFAELSVRLGEIAAGTQRRLGELAESFADDASRALVERDVTAGTPRRGAGKGSRKGGGRRKST